MAVSADPRIGSEFVGYRVEALVGRGGMGVVYRAYDPRLKRNVALKLVAPELSTDEGLRERFLAEAEVAAALEHPNVIPIHDAGEVDGRLYLAMRYVEGSDLKALLKQAGALEPAHALAICTQIADALDAAHERGLIHRDVKPSNVLLDQHEHVYLADFGLTRRLADRGVPAAEGLSLGTPAYASPEQIESGDVDGRADLYSLGCVLYECLTGQIPYPRDSELAVLWAHVQAPPPKASERRQGLPEAIDAVISKALEKEPAKRYATCREFIEAGRAVLAPGNVVAVRDRKPFRLAVLGALVLAGALAAALLLAFGSGGPGRPEPDLTVRDDSLVRIDPESNEIVAVTAVGGGPESVAVGGNIVWVYNWTDGTVSKVDARTGVLRGSIGITGSTPGVAAQTIAADASGAWVLSRLGTGGLLTHLRLGQLLSERFPFDGEPVTLAAGPNAVWVGVKSTRGSLLLEIQKKRGSILRTVRLGSSDIQSAAVGEGAVWALTQDGTLYRIDPVTARVTAKRLRTQGAWVASVATGFDAVWALLYYPGALLRVDPRTLEVTETVRPPIVPNSASIGGGVPNLVVGHGAVWWNGTDAGAVWRVDPESGNIVSTIQVGAPISKQTAAPLSLFEPLGMAIGAGSVWVTTSTPF